MSDEQPQAQSSNVSNDPLSGATRALKRNLLLASVVAIAFKAFKVSVDHISIAGISSGFDRGVFEFLIIVSLVYFLVTFCLYYYIDIKNIQKTDHQARTDSWQMDRLRQFTFRYWEETDKLARQVEMPPHTEVTLNKAYIHLLQQRVNKPVYPSIFDELKESGVLPLGAQQKADYLSVAVISNGNRAILSATDPGGRIAAERKNATRQVDTIALKRADEFPKRYRLYRARLLPRLMTVRSAYIIRNYGTDGIVPIVFAIYALCVIYNFFDPAAVLGWLPPEARPSR